MDATTTLLTVPQAAALVGVHRATVYRAIRSGDLRAGKLGRTGSYRIAREAVDVWLGDEGKAAQTTREMSGVLSKTDVVRLLVESDGSRRDIEISPGTWERSARALTAEERAAYVNASDDQVADARVLLRVAS